jgi:hypothetical protein
MLTIADITVRPETGTINISALVDANKVAIGSPVHQTMVGYNVARKYYQEERDTVTRTGIDTGGAQYAAEAWIARRDHLFNALREAGVDVPNNPVKLPF